MMPEVPAKRGRPKKGTELNLVECWKWRVLHKLTFQEIADRMHVSKSSVVRACHRLATLIPHPAQVEAYKNVKVELFNAVEQQLLASLMQPEKHEKASLNNVAYALTQVHTALRLETNQSTANVGIVSKLVEMSDERLFNGKAGHAHGQGSAGAGVAVANGNDGTGEASRERWKKC